MCTYVRTLQYIIPLYSTLCTLHVTFPDCMCTEIGILTHIVNFLLIPYANPAPNGSLWAADMVRPALEKAMADLYLNTVE